MKKGSVGAINYYYYYNGVKSWICTSSGSTVVKILKTYNHLVLIQQSYFKVVLKFAHVFVKVLNTKAKQILTNSNLTESKEFFPHTSFMTLLRFC